MGFAESFNRIDWEEWTRMSRSPDPAPVDRVIESGQCGPAAFASLISPAAESRLEALCRLSQRITQQRFGKVIRLFAPLYLSNECINNCTYCGFSRDNPILRVTLSPEEVRQEARALLARGFRNVLLVAGEHPRFVSSGYLEECLAALGKDIPALSLEVGPMETDQYMSMVSAGAEGLVVYQETYNRGLYSQLHTAGPKKNFDWRLETPERAYRAGFRRLGIGALFGLTHWREEALALAAHADHLSRTCWKAQLTIACPRLRPCTGSFRPPAPLSDRNLVQMLSALRIAFPDAGLVLSTRESARLRDGLIPLGITLMSAGSHTEPGGYTGAGRGNLHRTERGRMRPIEGEADGATGQFDIADHRGSEEVVHRIRSLGYEPVWKDWDRALCV